MTIFEAFLLGLVQGLTEFLPVSSSAHLIFFQHLLGFKESMLFYDIVLHLGTLAALFVFFAKDLAHLVRDSIYGIFYLLRGKSWKSTFEIVPYFRWAVGIIVASVPTGLMGIFLKDWFEAMFGSLEVTGITLILNSAILWLTLYFRDGNKKMERVRITDFLIIGILQGISIVPGISRSGATIAGGLFLGMERETAFRFSFLIAIPAILGAGLLEIPDAATGLGLTHGIGFLVSAVSGLFALFLLRRMMRQGKLQAFALYTLLFGILILSLTQWLE